MHLDLRASESCLRVVTYWRRARSRVLHGEVRTGQVTPRNQHERLQQSTTEAEDECRQWCDAIDTQITLFTFTFTSRHGASAPKKQHRCWIYPTNSQITAKSSKSTHKPGLCTGMCWLLRVAGLVLQRQSLPTISDYDASGACVMTLVSLRHC